jgi:hypothetical protein
MHDLTHADREAAPRLAQFCLSADSTLTVRSGRGLRFWLLRPDESLGERHPCTKGPRLRHPVPGREGGHCDSFQDAEEHKDGRRELGPIDELRQQDGMRK